MLSDAKYIHLLPHMDMFLSLLSIFRSIPMFLLEIFVLEINFIFMKGGTFTFKHFNKS